MKDKDIVKQFEKDYTAMDNFWSSIHQRHKNATRFVYFYDQWDKEAQSARTSRRGVDGKPLPPRPTNVFNITLPYIQKVENGVKKMHPSVTVKPGGGEEDKALADVGRGMVISIQRTGEAAEARNAAIKDQICSGYGFYYFYTDYEDPKSMDQEIKYEKIEDPTQVLWDENSTKTSGSDCKKVQFRKGISKEEFKKLSGQEWEEFYNLHETHESWGTNENPTITEYWFVEEKEETLVRVKPDFEQYFGKTAYLSEIQQAVKVENSDLSGINPEYIAATNPQTGKMVSRQSTSRQVWWTKLCGGKVLKKVAWPGYWIPVFKVQGRKEVSENQTRYDGLAAQAKASQKIYNFARNAQIEDLSMSIKARIFHPKGGVDSTEKKKYSSANNRYWDSLEYNQYDENMNPLNPPQLIQPRAQDPQTANEVLYSSEELKATLGIYSAYMGDAEGARSGKAVLAEAAESSDVVYDFAVNLGHTIEHEGRVLMELIPKIFTTPKQVLMVGDDDKEKTIWVNAKAQNEKGKEYYYDLRNLKANISVEMGPSNATKREETRESMETFMKAMPEFAESFADIYAQEQDWRKKEQVANRVQKILEMKYPGLTKENDDEPPQELVQAQQAIEEMKAQLMELAKENQDLKTDKSIEAEKVIIERFKAETDRLKAKSDAAIDVAKVELEADKIEITADAQSAKIDQDDAKMAIDASLKAAQQIKTKEGEGNDT